MKKRSKFTVYSLYLLALLMLITVAQMVVTPMRRPARILEHQILRITPLGTCIEEVVELINSRNDWINPMVNRDFGFNPLSPWSEREFLHHHRRGEKFATVHLGQYRTWLFWPPFVDVGVGIAWIFDSDGKLIEVFINKIASL